MARDLGLKPKRDDAGFAALMDALDGHPLAIRAVLLRPGEVPAERLLAELKQELAGAAKRDFVDFMGAFADRLAPKELHEQRFPFAVHGASFHQALALAAELRMDTHVAALTQSLAIKEKQGNEHGTASTYGQLGNLTLAQQDLASAGAWFLRAIGLFAKVNDSHSMGMAVHLFGRNLQATEPATREQLIKLEDLERQVGGSG